MLDNAPFFVPWAERGRGADSTTRTRHGSAHDRALCWLEAKLISVSILENHNASNKSLQTHENGRVCPDSEQEAGMTLQMSTLWRSKYGGIKVVALNIHVDRSCNVRVSTHQPKEVIRQYHFPPAGASTWA
jgi:hypothetical protein